jgi:hypothetical protein
MKISKILGIARISCQPIALLIYSSMLTGCGVISANMVAQMAPEMRSMVMTKESTERLCGFYYYAPWAPIEVRLAVANELIIRRVRECGKHNFSEEYSKVKWETAENSRDPDLYWTFAREYPGDFRVHSAADKLWDSIKTEGNASSLAEFVKVFRKTARSDEAVERIWLLIEANPREEDLRQFIDMYSWHARADDAVRAIWERMKNSSNPEVIWAFAKTYQKHKSSDEALGRTWNYSRESGNLVSLQTFVQDFKNTSYIANAQRALAELQLKEMKEAKDKQSREQDEMAQRQAREQRETAARAADEVRVTEERRKQTLEASEIYSHPTFLFGTRLIRNPVKGVDPQHIISELQRRRPPTKSQFETSAAFESRIDIWRIALFKTLPFMNRRFAVIQPVSKIKSFQADDPVEYDADRELMQLTIKDGYRCGVTYSQRVRTVGSFLGTNAFGALVRVTETIEDNTCLFDDSIESIKIDLTVPRTKAETLSKALGIVYIGRLKDPYLEELSDRFGPKLDQPRAETINIKRLIMDIEFVWVINMNTGEVMKKTEMKKAS